jgi:outer membrane lipoprotein carrier protein
MIRFAFGLWLTLIGTASALESSARARLDAFAHDVHTLRGVFTQRALDPHGAAHESRGTFALAAPRQFRWETTAPMRQLIVADGVNVWIYDPDLEQVTVRAQDREEAHSPLTVLTDLARLDRDFSTQEQGEHDGLAWLRLRAKDTEPQFHYCDLGFDRKGLARMVFEDTLGNRTEIRFSDWERNPRLAPELFHFTPPPGVDVIGTPRPPIEVHAISDRSLDSVQPISAWLARMGERAGGYQARRVGFPPASTADPVFLRCNRGSACAPPGTG